MKLPQRKVLRIPGHDYGSMGCYFVTFCVAGRRRCLGQVDTEHVELTRTGRVVNRELVRLPDRFEYVDVDAFQIMPDHVHAIICLCDDSTDQVKFRTFGRVQRGSLPMVVNQFKGAVTKKVKHTIDPSFAWQRGYFERVIRHDRELLAIREYIASNPLRWHLERRLGITHTHP